MMSQAQPIFIRAYDIGLDVKLQFTLIPGKPGTNDQVRVDLLGQPQSAILPLVMMNPDLIEPAFHQFEQDRLAFFKQHLPHRYKAIVQ